MPEFAGFKSEAVGVRSSEGGADGPQVVVHDFFQAQVLPFFAEGLQELLVAVGDESNPSVGVDAGLVMQVFFHVVQSQVFAFVNAEWFQLALLNGEHGFLVLKFAEQHGWAAQEFVAAEVFQGAHCDSGGLVPLKALQATGNFCGVEVLLEEFDGALGLEGHGHGTAIGVEDGDTILVFARLNGLQSKAVNAAYVGTAVKAEHMVMFAEQVVTPMK